MIQQRAWQTIPRLAYAGLLVYILFAAPSLRAAAWLMPEGKGQLINNLFWYRTKESFSPSGDKRPSPRFAKLEYNPYLEYGWKKDITLGISPSLQLLSQEQTPGADRNFGLGDIEVFARKELFRHERGVISIQPLIKLPGPYDDHTTPPLGAGQVDAELRILGGVNFPLLGRWHYYNIEGAYRKRAGNPADEWRLDQTLGFTLSDDWSILMQSYQVFSATSGASPLLLSNSSNYDLSKFQLSLVKMLRNGTKLQGGGFIHADGKNTGAGQGLLLSWWLPF